jgi:hypothetical protein
MMTITELIQRLAEGWKDERDDFAQEFVARWQAHLRAEGKISHGGENVLHFDLNLSGIRLHGIDNVACLMISGDGTGSGRAVWDFWHQVNSTDRLVFILALSERADEQARAALPNVRCLRLRPEQICEVMVSCEPRERLKALIRDQFPRHQLIPYDITQPVNENMFFGRGQELDRLCYEPETSFAIAGAGRLGKTSLGVQFHRRLVREHDPRAQRKHQVDFYACTDRTSDGVARFLAMEIEPSRRSHEMTTQDLGKFLRHQFHKHDAPIELLLDELDEVCQVEAFDILTMAARRGFCRLILCGRGNLLKAVLNESSPLKGRVELLRLQPLDKESAQSLILEPLNDLGLKIKEQDRLIEQVFDWTGRLPHLLQFYGKRLASLALAEEPHIVSTHHVDKIRNEFETAQIFARQLDGLADAQTRTLALQLLHEGNRFLTVSQVQEIAERRGIHLDYSRAVDVCNDLVINNVLAWHDNAYSIANHSIVHYARKMRLQDGLPQPGPFMTHLPA